MKKKKRKKKRQAIKIKIKYFHSKNLSHYNLILIAKGKKL